MNERQKLGNPIFIFSVFILILNDWCLKQAFSNELTGKLSDFSGLFAFPFLLSAILPRRAIKVYVFTSLIFITWKLPIVQPFIKGLNNLGIPVGRTIDYTDYAALIVLPFSFYIFNRPTVYSLKPIVLNGLVILSSLAFIATSMPPGKNEKFVGINKTYSFDFSRRELISRLNMVQLEYVDAINKYGAQVDFDSKKNIFHFKDRKDTLAMILDYEKIKDTDTISLHTSYAEINISGSGNSSNLKLLSIYKFVPWASKADYKAKAIRVFERSIIRKIKHYRNFAYKR
jgi:hypothetical protein